MMMMMILR